MSAGKKSDEGKLPIVRGVFAYFPRALLEIARISRYGKVKYTVPYEEKNWEKVEDGPGRYADAGGRHLLQRFIDGENDPESTLPHMAHEAWNILAKLELALRAKEGVTSPPPFPLDSLEENMPQERAEDTTGPFTDGVDERTTLIR